MSQDRKGEITYINIMTHVVKSNHPIDIAQDDTIISSFDASQACYIGILVGIYAAKYGTNISVRENKRPILQVIK